MSRSTEEPVTPKKQDDLTGLVPLNIIRTETVLSRLPIHNLAKKGTVDIKITKTGEHGNVELFWKVSPHSAFGEPRQLAYKLDTLIINRRLDEMGRPLPEVVCLGSLRDIARGLDLGNNTPVVKKALRQNAHTVIAVKLKYKDREGAEREADFESTRYGVIFTGERLPDGKRADAVYIVLNPPYRRILNNAPIRPLDYHYLQVLPPGSQRFYEIVSYRVFAALKYRRPSARLLYSEYCTYAPQQRYYDYDHFKKQMYKVHKPHLQSGYVQKISYKATTDSDGEPDWLMFYIPGPKARTEYRKFSREHLVEGEVPEGDVDEVDQQAPPASQEPTAVQAVQLVKHFYKLFHGVEDASPRTKEIHQATPLITEHGFEKARFIIEFAHQAAPETNYKPQTFAGILHYCAQAIAGWEQRERQRAELSQRQAREQERRRQEEEVYRQREAHLEDLRRRAPKRYQALYEQAKAKALNWLSPTAKPETLETAIRANMISELDRQQTAKDQNRT